MGHISEYKNLVALICPQCGKEKLLRPYLAKTQVYCSVECADKSSWLTFVCQQCGEDFTRRKCVTKQRSPKFCSMTCSSKANIGKTRARGEENKNYNHNAEIRSCAICGVDMRITPGKSKTKKYCSRECQYGAENLGLPKAYCVDCGKELSKPKYVRCSDCAHSGKNNPAWKGGVTTAYHLIRTSGYYANWRIGVFERDNYTCTKCGDNTGGNLNAHHKMMFSEILQKYGIDNLDDAMNCEALWDISNGETLCVECHKKEHKILKIA